MEKLLFTLILVLAVGIIYLITGRNRRQINKIPEGMAILCQPPGKRYVVYALGVLAVVFVGIFSILYIMDGAPGEARGMWSLCVAVAILLLIVTIFAGNIMARECIYFNGDTIQIEKAFQKPRTVRWQEIRKIDGSFDNMVNLLTGPKGSGKTQQMIERANEAVKTCEGNVFFIKKSHRDTYSLSFNIRAICMDDYDVITNTDEYLGFIYGMLSADHDIKAIFIDGILKHADITLENIPSFIETLKKISKENDVDFYVSISATNEQLGNVDFEDCTLLN